MKKIALALALAGLLAPKSLWGQADKQNLWYNPGFEIKDEYRGEPIYDRWSFNGQPITNFNFNTEKPHSGANSLKLFPTAKGALSIYDADWDLLQRYPAKSGDVFTLSYWHRGSLNVDALEVTIRAYSAKDKYSPILEKTIAGSKVLTQQDWAKKTVAIRIDNADRKADMQDQEIAFFEISLEMPFVFNSDKVIYLDDFELIEGAPEPEVKLEAPAVINTAAFEREIELSWQADTDKQVTWEVVVGDQTFPVSQPNYILTGLEPRKDYTIKVCSVKGQHKSAYKEIKTSTSLILKNEDDETRLPYLRTLNSAGTASQTINLFYSDLYRAKEAKFTYWINGREVKPEGYKLTFPQKGENQELKIRIEEAPSQIWELTYILEII